MQAKSGTLTLRRGGLRPPGVFAPGAIWRFARRKPLGALGGLVIALLIVMAVFAGPIARRDPTSIPVGSVAEDRLRAPDRDHLMGTDDRGRDIFARVVYGSRVSLEVGIISVTIAATIGTVLGLVSGYFGGWFDTLLQRLVDAQMAFPGLVLGLVLVGLLGQKLHYVFIAVGIVALPTYIRLVRASALSVKQNLYVEAAKVLGAGNARIMFRHILPNVMAPIVVVATAGLGGAILVEASLSFLGFGPPPPAPSWGRMLAGESRLFMLGGAWWMAVFPGMAITLTVLAFNLLGDALRDVLDPRLRGT